MPHGMQSEREARRSLATRAAQSWPSWSYNAFGGCWSGAVAGESSPLPSSWLLYCRRDFSPIEKCFNRFVVNEMLKLQRNHKLCFHMYVSKRLEGMKDYEAFSFHVVIASRAPLERSVRHLSTDSSRSMHPASSWSLK